MDKLRIIILTLFSFQRLFVSIAFANFHVTGDSQYYGEKEDHSANC